MTTGGPIGLVTLQAAKAYGAGKNNAANRHMGDLPETGKWVRLEVDAGAVDLGCFVLAGREDVPFLPDGTLEPGKVRAWGEAELRWAASSLRAPRRRHQPRRKPPGRARRSRSAVSRSKTVAR